MSLKALGLLQAPLVTERSAIMKEKYNQYVFKVHPDATKYDVKEIIESVFKVNVQKVRTANCSGKMRRLAAGRPQGKRPDWKKAIVTLKKGQEIKLEDQIGK